MKTLKVAMTVASVAMTVASTAAMASADMWPAYNELAQVPAHMEQYRGPSAEDVTIPKFKLTNAIKWDDSEASSTIELTAVRDLETGLVYSAKMHYVNTWSSLDLTLELELDDLAVVNPDKYPVNGTWDQSTSTLVIPFLQYPKTRFNNYEGETQHGEWVLTGVTATSYIFSLMFSYTVKSECGDMPRIARGAYEYQYFSMWGCYAIMELEE